MSDMGGGSVHSWISVRLGATSHKLQARSTSIVRYGWKRGGIDPAERSRMRLHTPLRGISTILFGLLAACTGSIDTGEGGGDDGPDVPTTEVRVVVTDALAGQAGVRVIFQNADDSVIEDVMTDASGVATAEMTAGNVSVIRTYVPVLPPPPEGNRVPEVYTYVGVKGGDLIELGKSEPTAMATPGAIVVKVPEIDGTVTVKTPCGSGAGEAPNVAITVTNCPAMMDMYVTQNDQGFYMQKPYAENIDVSMGVLNESLASTVTATNVPPNAQVNVEQKIYAGSFELFSTGEKRVDQTPQNVDMPNITGVDGLVVTRVSVQNQGAVMTGARTSYSGAVASVDASAHPMPYIMGTTKFEPAGITWTEAGTGAAEAVMVTLAVTRGAAMGMTPGPDAEYVRAIIAPHAAGVLRIPALPDARYNPSSLDEIGGAIGLVSSSGGYDTIRRRAFAKESIVDAAPAGGSISIAYSGQAPGF
jgi:hypothetical protein